MNPQLDSFTQSFLNKFISDYTVEELQNITQDYPYFAPAQLALLKKLKQEHLPQYETQLQKAVLYYYDPLQFEAFVNSQKFITDFDFTSPKQAPPETIVEERSTIEEVAAQPPTEDEIIAIEIEQQADNETGPLTDTLNAIVKVPGQEIISKQPFVSTENIPALPQLAPASDNALAFEPYHTVDYFASQGIKLSREEAGKDRMGKQLKSFTEWLKTMKRLPAPELAKSIDTSAEHQVENLAAHSLEKTDIVTEAMAEVWLKQGNVEQAAVVYNKLSLQNPSKKAYFAAKIEQLKKAP